MTTIEVMKQALGYLEIYEAYGPVVGLANTTIDDAITAIRAIEQVLNDEAQEELRR